MKKILIATVLIFSAIVSTEAKPRTDGWRGYISNRFWDNSFLSAGGGVHIYSGLFSGDWPFGTRICPTFEVGAGTWLNPFLGGRLQVSAGGLKGYTRLTDHDLLDAGVVTDDGLYGLKWGQAHLHADLLLNLSSSFRGYDPDRLFDLIAFGGFGLMHSWEGNGHNTIPFTLGLIGKLQINELFDLNIEYKVSMMDPKYVAESMANRGPCTLQALTVGFSYKFRQAPWRRAFQY